jgi:hypothetical protein
MNTQQNQQDTRLNLVVQLCILLQHLSEPSTDLCNIFAFNKFTKGTRLPEYQKRRVMTLLEKVLHRVALYNIFIKYLLLLRWEIHKFAFLDEVDQAEIELVSRKIAL